MDVFWLSLWTPAFIAFISSRILENLKLYRTPQQSFVFGKQVRKMKQKYGYILRLNSAGAPASWNLFSYFKYKIPYTLDPNSLFNPFSSRIVIDMAQS